MGSILNKLKLLSGLLICFGIPVLLHALPQDLDTFFDFENITAEGTDFTIGQSPFTVRVINFTLETVENPSLTHSGTKALVLVPGAQEGKILFERGVNLVQFYAAETNGSGRLELRDKNFFTLVEQGVVVGLPADISPGANPPLQSFVSFSGDSADTTDLNYTAGIKEIKVVNVSGQFSIDDLGFTYVDGPPNNTVFEDFEGVAGNPVFASLANFTLGQPPFTATFTGGVVQGLSAFPAFNHSFPTLPATAAGSEVLQAAVWIIINEFTGTITFETPAFQVQFYAAVFFEGDGEIQVFDTNDNLLTSTKDIPLNINIAFDVPFTFFDFNAEELGAPEGIGKITYINGLVSTTAGSFDNISLDDFGFTPIGAPGTGTSAPPPADAPSITSQPSNQEVQSGASASLSVVASGIDLTYQWYTGNSGDTANPVTGATGSSFDTGALTANTNFWVQVNNAGGTANSDTSVITIAAPAVPLVLEGTGDIAGENIMHPNGNIFDQILLTGESIQLQARPNQITRVSFMDESEDIVQVEFSGVGTFTVTLDPATFLLPAIPPRYNQAVEYVTGKPSVVIDGADANTFFSIFTVGSINAVNQALFPEGQIYDAQADVTLVEVVNSTGMGGMQLSNTVFSGSTGKVGVDARGLPIAVRLTVGDIDADGDAVPHLLFGEGSFTVPRGQPWVANHRW